MCLCSRFGERGFASLSMGSVFSLWETAQAKSNHIANRPVQCTLVVCAEREGVKRFSFILLVWMTVSLYRAVVGTWEILKGAKHSNLVDPASSHTLVSKIKPCMCKYKQLFTVKLRTAHYISYSLFDNIWLLDNRSNSRANTCAKSRLFGRDVFIR